MQNSISSSFEKSDFELDEVNNSSRWKSVKSRCELVAGPEFYSVLYGIASHSIHGNWQDILYNDLRSINDEGYILDLEWHSPRPQLLDATIQINLDISNVFAEKELIDVSLSEDFKKKAKEHFDYWEFLKQSHEKWLNKTKGG
jgi:hypothetical protein